jgi:excisionase family DNA binding protein
MEIATLVDASTVAEKLGQARSSIYRLARAGRIPSYAAGPRRTGLRFSVEEVMAALRRPMASSEGATKVSGEVVA